MIAVADYTSSLIEGAFLLKRVTFPEPRVERVVLPIQEKDSQKTVFHQGKDKSAHNEIKDFYVHMALTDECRSASYFCRYSGNIA